MKLNRSRKNQTFAKLLLAIILAAVLIVTLLGKRSYRWGLEEGNVSSADIYAPFDFSYVDEKATVELKTQRVGEVKPVYNFDPELYQKVLGELSAFYKSLGELPEGAETDEASGLSISDTRLALNSENAEQVYEKIEQLVKFIMLKEISGEIDPKIGLITIRNTLTNAEKEQDAAKILTLKSAGRDLAGQAATLFEKERRLRGEIIDSISHFIRPNLSYNQAETVQRKQLATDNTPPVMKKIREHELIVGNGQIVTFEQVAQLDALAERQAHTRLLSTNLGISLLVIIFIVLMSAYLYRYAPKIYMDNQNLVLISTILFLVIVIAKLIGMSEISNYLIPVSAGSMLTALLLEPRLAIMMAGVLAIFTGIISGSSLGIAIVAFVGGIVGVYFIIGTRRRSQLIKAGAIIGVANFICIIGLGLLNRIDPRLFIRDGAWGFGSGIASSVVVTIFLPIFEYLFKVTTNISLLELSDLNHPVLRKMAAEAPGTYHHALIVGNLAEAASEAIGANSLLARVASYYHDIGKIEKAEYFSENQSGAKQSKHDNLTPSMSNLIILNHVKNGAELAEKHKLNKAIVDIIKEHHGTSQVFYFYKRALEKMKDEQELEDMSFRYPGPKPQTRESAIVLLADSIEAASRSLSDPNPGSIEGMVQKIINNKFIDGQLEECELALKDLHKIADSFSRVLMGIFHTRVDYPEEASQDVSKKTEPNAGKHKKPPEQGPDKN